MSDQQTKQPVRHGQGLAEYALILALIAIVAVIALFFLGANISAILSGQQAELAPPAPTMLSGPANGVRVSPLTNSTVMISGPARPDGLSVLVRVVCPGSSGKWRPAEPALDDGWVAILKPTAASGCKVQAAEVRDDALSIFGEAALELPPAR